MLKLNELTFLQPDPSVKRSKFIKKRKLLIGQTNNKIKKNIEKI